MTWADFWAPQLVQWIVGGTITAIVGTIVGLVARYLLKRWYDTVGKPWLEAWLKDVIGHTTAAVTSSKEAAAAGEEAKKAALAVMEESGRLVTLLPDREQALEYLKEINNGLLGQNSRLIAQLVLQAKKHPEDFESASAPRPRIPIGDPESDPAIFVSGRHLLDEDSMADR